jgi:hypothetical protein
VCEAPDTEQRTCFSWPLLAVWPPMGSGLRLAEVEPKPHRKESHDRSHQNIGFSARCQRNRTNYARILLTVWARYAWGILFLFYSVTLMLSQVF